MKVRERTRKKKRHNIKINKRKEKEREREKKRIDQTKYYRRTHTHTSQDSERVGTQGNPYSLFSLKKTKRKFKEDARTSRTAR